MFKVISFRTQVADDFLKLNFKAGVKAQSSLDGVCPEVMGVVLKSLNLRGIANLLKTSKAIRSVVQGWLSEKGRGKETMEMVTFLNFLINHGINSPYKWADKKVPDRLLTSQLNAFKYMLGHRTRLDLWTMPQLEMTALPSGYSGDVNLFLGKRGRFYYGQLHSTLYNNTITDCMFVSSGVQFGYQSLIARKMVAGSVEKRVADYHVKLDEVLVHRFTNSVGPSRQFTKFETNGHYLRVEGELNAVASLGIEYGPYTNLNVEVNRFDALYNWRGVSVFSNDILAGPCESLKILKKMDSMSQTWEGIQVKLHGIPEAGPCQSITLETEYVVRVLEGITIEDGGLVAPGRCDVYEERSEDGILIYRGCEIEYVSEGFALSEGYVDSMEFCGPDRKRKALIKGVSIWPEGIIKAGYCVEVETVAEDGQRKIWHGVTLKDRGVIDSGHCNRYEHWSADGKLLERKEDIRVGEFGVVVSNPLKRKRLSQ